MSARRAAKMRSAEIALRDAVNAVARELTFAELVQVAATVLGSELGRAAEAEQKRAARD